MREEFEGFIKMSKTELKNFDEEGFAMFRRSFFCSDYFKSVKKSAVTEIKVIDTYWRITADIVHFTELKNIKSFFK